ncbi:MAG: TRAP transporter small permease [Synergistaceae bacterium]|jgi:TRAP-type C4-dicarboxylate transport system permease small subunit|nr:TRAP transporter small permease [Synergistaceae bacterium]
MRWLRSLSDGLNVLCKWAGAVLLLAMVAIIVVQVIARYVLGSSLSWTEETSRFFFIWIVLLGTMIGVHDGSHVAVEFLLNWMPKPLSRFIKWVYTLCLCVLAGVMIGYGIDLTISVSVQLSPATRISMAYVYSAVPVCSMIMLIHLLRDLLPIGAGETKGSV